MLDLHALKNLGDKDVCLWDSLMAKAPTGHGGIFRQAIPFSQCRIKMCTGSWAGAREAPELAGVLGPGRTCSRIRHAHAELGSCARWGQVAVGKMNVVQSTGRNVRLIMDPSISGIIAACEASAQHFKQHWFMRCLCVFNPRHSLSLCPQKRTVEDFQSHGELHHNLV